MKREQFIRVVRHEAMIRAYTFEVTELLRMGDIEPARGAANELVKVSTSLAELIKSED